ncbi:MAG: succinyl-diaminopimelate desuccinylase [Gammaproteobacteria bacterium]|nr:succinyl-diaminopimelate desuccinylase [Gammaproteobacteria bacterium]
MTDTATLSLAKQLLAIESVTPKDAGCMEVMGARLEALGFKLEIMQFGEVTNLWARRGETSPVLCFAGHTDVVPTGPIESWQFPPFEPTEHNGMLYGRGAADMKGSIACWLVALEEFIATNPNHEGSIALLITSDEEGPAKDGTVRVIETLESRGEKIDWCIVGEPSSTHKVGDIIKNGRRGSLNAKVSIHGVQGHVAYPHLVTNPIHMLAPALAELTSTKWDEGNDYFPPTSFQVSNFNAGTGATNVVAGTADLLWNFRFSTQVSDQQLINWTEDILHRHQVKFSIDWNTSGQPFLTEPGALVEACQKSILANTGYATELSTSGGTSDGRFIAPTGAQVVELGPRNNTIHQLNECVSINDLESLTGIYHGVLVQLLGD